jgi:hypothetical protein
MELDARVKALEYELKILKNEIQRTLLDIQEQVLIHYYPTLRSEDSAPPAEAVAQLAARPFPAAPPAETAAQIAARTIPAGPPPSTPVPAIKKVSLDEIRAAQPTAVAITPKASGSVDQATMVKLLEWVNDSIARLGSKRTSSLIETCVARAILDNDTKAILLRLTSMNQQPDPAQVPANDALTMFLRLDEVLGRAAEIDEALTVVDEAGLG